ncbi:VTT domain-containing protein [Bacillus tianshenii]|uniref:TVP38/TMEM64 family protein n=1 Tax=Sutcliffiella tianshenii TaxID=1463404 RepID=UPI001CD2AE62|nr:VTT domain-containing protein [Bacillus tianshenii]MCA1321739.1 VTT domain-containing protein [Bacillus tianshenii]
MWKDFVLEWLDIAGPFAILLSIIFNTVISILAFVPSVFITAANIAFFGFWVGTLVSFLGESVGAVVSFLLYRKGLKAFSPKALERNKWLVRLQGTEGHRAFLLVLGLRLFPFAPSGLVTLAGATSRISLIHFAIASTLGKVPALLLEAYSVYRVLEWGTEGKIILTLFSIGVVGMLFFRRK